MVVDANVVSESESLRSPRAKPVDDVGVYIGSDILTAGAGLR